jgi:putative transposase
VTSLRLAAVSVQASGRPRLDDRGGQVRFLLHDRDSKLSAASDAVFATEGIRIVRTPVQAPNANAHVERLVGSVRRECLDRLLIVGRRPLEHVLRALRLAVRTGRVASSRA